MKFSQTFKIYKEENTQENLILIKDVYRILCKGGDNIQWKNLRRALISFQGGLRTYLNNECATVLSVLKYICHHNTTSACKTILRNIEYELVSSKPSSERNSLELYKLLAKTQVLRTSALFNNLDINENEIPTLVVDYKKHFNEAEWRRICWFESDFSKYVQFNEHSYEDAVNLKFSRLSSLLNLNECCKQWNRSSKGQIRKNTLRFKSSKKDDEIRLITSQVHIASVIDNDIKYVTDIYCPETIESVVSFDVTKSKDRNCIWAVFVQTGCLEIDFRDLCTRVFYALKRKHNFYLENVSLTYSHQLSEYCTSDGKMSRYGLRDALELHQFDKVASSWQANTHIDGTIDLEGCDHHCESCFSVQHNKPLSSSNFDISQEWYIGSPIETQILFEQFINFNSIRKSKIPEESIKKKLEKLYIVYDILLNILNKNYIGLFQQNNANKLLIEYKSIGSVFDVTAAAGATSSLSHAENQLKKESNVDLCYYNTYLKEHSLEYQATNDTLKTHVNLRACHLIFMLDNLVRLQYIADPNPSEHRSKQICTLPITIQGLPTDSEITDEWHLPECDGRFDCICKQPLKIQDDDITRTLLELLDNEKEAYFQFFNFMSFGTHFLWKRLPDELLEHIHDCQVEDDANSAVSTYLDIPLSNQEQELLDDVEVNDESQSEIDEDLLKMLGSIESSSDDAIVDPYVSDDEEELEPLPALEKSMEEMSILDKEEPQDTSESIQRRLRSFGLTKFKVPPILCRHPPPATGRDDDVEKIREILDDALVKTGYEADPSKGANRILCGPENKIGKCLLQLAKYNPKYQIFLPEFPLLHLRKSKINILFSAYKDAGIIQLLKFMRNDEHDDWAKLISIQHIDMATRHVKRMALALHLAFLIGFTQQLDTIDVQELLSDLEIDNCATTSSKWSGRFSDYLANGSARNATFALHVDMMGHCDAIVAIAFAERLGGSTGYNLLLAAVKNSLLFSFVNGAASYAPYCVLLLHSHYSAGHFHQCMKHVLYSTPFKNSNKNFACDTKREMDHLDVVKGFRSGSNIESVTCRMSLIDSLNEPKLSNDSKLEQMEDDDKLGMDLSEVDLNHIYPTACLILRRGALSLDESATPCNIYANVTLLLPQSILDSASEDVGRYLLDRYLRKEKLISKEVNEKNVHIHGPVELVNRAKRSKGITIKRTQKSKVLVNKTEKQTKEEQRLKEVAKETKLIDAFSSESNTCQALLKPDSSKPKVSKAIGIQRALKNLIISCSPSSPLDQYIALNLLYVPRSVTNTMKICTVEFAGIKFKVGNVKTGYEYLQSVGKYLNGILKENTASIVVICEEKYSFTPDDFKASTRAQRQSKTENDVRHLKASEHILSNSVFDKSGITKTETGKRLISTYLAKNIEKIKIDRDVAIIVDSELITKKECTCSCNCECRPAYSIPIHCEIKTDDDNGISITEMNSIRQNKGEAEMSVVDWILYLQSQLEPGDTAVCFVTSADIDAIYLHLYGVSRFWTRNEDGTYKNTMYVVLQKLVEK